MCNFNFDWRWVALILGIIVLMNARALPWWIPPLLLGGAGSALLYQGVRILLGGGRAGAKVTYWRGQRIELAPQRRGLALSGAGLRRAAPQLIGATMLLLTAAAIGLRAVGL